MLIIQIWTFICWKPTHFLSAQMAFVSTFFQMFILLGMYNFDCSINIQQIKFSWALSTFFERILIIETEFSPFVGFTLIGHFKIYRIYLELWSCTKSWMTAFSPDLRIMKLSTTSILYFPEFKQKSLIFLLVLHFFKCVIIV